MSCRRWCPHFQPQRAKVSGQRGDRVEYRCQAVTIRQCIYGLVQTDQLARENQFAERQRLVVECDDGITAVVNDVGLFGDDRLVQACLTQCFLRAILLEAGAAIQQPLRE
ncbi:MAG: hypothetical protein Q7S94_07600 [Gallionella sp.]|nr:hypothetical protein [Gallionella sp.]